MKQIGIFPASGALGGSTYRHLFKLVPNDNVTLINRYPEKVEDEYKQAGAIVRRASYESTPQELEAAFSGIDVLFLVSYPSHVHEYRVKVQLPAIDAAHHAGVKHIFYSSLGFANDLATSSLKASSLAVVMQAHLDSEKHLQSIADSDNSFTYTSVREGLYSESFPLYTAFFEPKDAPTHSEVQIPHDGSGPGVSWVKRDELGEATAKLIASYVGIGAPFPKQYVNEKLLLSGSKEFTLAETVEVLGKTVRKAFKIKEIPVDEYVKLPSVLSVFGSQEKARTWATAWAGIKAGETALITPDMEQILGRKPEEYEMTIQNMLA